MSGCIVVFADEDPVVYRLAALEGALRVSALHIESIVKANARMQAELSEVRAAMVSALAGRGP